MFRYQVMEFGNRLIHARTAAGLSQRQLGALMGLGKQTGGIRVNRYEKGADPSMAAARALAAALCMPLAYLFADTQELADAILAHVTARVANRIQTT